MYEGKILQWQLEDEKVEKVSRPVPFAKYPEGHCRNWLLGRSKVSESGKVTFDSKETQDVSKRIKEKQLQAS